MKLAIVIIRSPEYRLYAPVIEAALARGWEVECWHDYSQARIGLKGYQFPSIDLAPAFRNGRPLIRSYGGPPELRAWLARMRADAVIAGTPDVVNSPLPASRPLWVCQQYFLDSVLFGPDSLLTWDVLAMHSQWWLEWAGGYFESEGLVADRDAFVREAERRTTFLGLPEADAARLIDPDEVRRRWGIPPGQPVVVLFPFPQGVGRNIFWPRRICIEPSRLKQLASIIAFRRFQYWSHMWHGWNDRNVVRALRRFCDRNGAYLLVKSRRKTPIPAYTEALADQCVYDEGFYPATILEALSISSLSVSYYSNAVFESVSLGVPHLCLTYAAEDYNGTDAKCLARFYNPKEGSAFQFRGVSTALCIPEALSQLPAKTLSDFAIDAEAQDRYVQKFLTHGAGNGGVRTIEAIEQALGRKRGTSRN